jgi:magnesium transporter
MPEINGLSVAFATAHPADAARVLTELAPADAAAFLSALEPDAAAPVLRHMGPVPCARVLTQLDEVRAVALIGTLGAQAAALLLQQLPAERQARVLAQLPVASAMAVRMLTGYPQGTCGASMHPGPLALTADTPVPDALDQARRFDGEIGDSLFIIDDRYRLRGVVGLGDLLRAPPRAALTAVMRAPEHTLSALARLSSVAEHPGWDSYRVLPVLEREERLVGALDRRTLWAALRATVGRPGAEFAGVAGAYWETLSLLTQVVVRTLPPVPPVAGTRRNDEC